jgi:asparagine synthase (glutamine-hydrolysing)
MTFTSANRGTIADIEQLTAMMDRRGPDGGGVWSDGAACRLGFRRLAILDLTAAADQPMLTSDGRYALVFNGEMYNFQELRQALQHEGVAFRSTGDTEVVLYALVHWGKAALERFNGMFALAFYDTIERRLLLARDHAGIKPLYYLLTSEGVFCASQYNQLLAHPWSRGLAVSPDALALYLRLGYIPAPYALLQNTYMLEAGSWLEVTADGRTWNGRYYDFPLFRTPDLQGQEAYEAVNAAVSAAVKRQMISDVPIGVFLSGGIDSPLVAAKMQATSSSAIRAFTIGSQASRFDESAAATRYAHHLGLDHVVEHVTPAGALGMLNDVIAACGEPFADYSIFPTMLVSQLARRDVTVMLSGDGGDELFWGYVGRFGSILQSARDFRRPLPWRSLRWGSKKLLNWGNGHENLCWPSIGDWYRAKHTRLPEYWLSRLLPELPAWPAGFGLYDYAGWQPDVTAQWLRWNEFIGHLTMVLLKVDRASMYHSLEVRVPLLDREVIEVATRVDWHSCLDVGHQIGKLPLRATLAAHVPQATTAKRGFSVPMDDWLRGALRPTFETQVVQQAELLGLGLERPVAEQLFQLHLSGERDYSWGLWVLLSLALWEKTHYRSSERASVGQPVAQAAW